jgi:hypothetical protein
VRGGAPYLRPDSRDPKKLVETGKHHCLTSFCRGVVHKRNERSPYCSRCRNLRWREKFPLHYSFKNLRVRALQRGKEFTLTLNEYLEFAEKTDYGKLKGKTSLSLSIDRIENCFGYHAWNISALQIRENSKKSYVAFFNGGVLPEIQKEEYLQLEKDYCEPLKKIADALGQKHGLGTPKFWEEFNKQKLELYQP